MGRCTWSSAGCWGVKGVDLAKLPPNAYGALCKLHDIEKLAEEIDVGQGSPGYDRAYLVEELLRLCGVKGGL